MAAFGARASRACNCGIKPDFLPPRGFITAAMHLAMVSSTQWHSELVAHFATKRPALREAQVMGIRRLATANQTRLLCHISDVTPVSHPTRLR